MAFRGEPPPPQMPPSLLQMAQGVAPAVGGAMGNAGVGDLAMLGQVGDGRGGGQFQSDPMLNNGAPFRAITSPEDQNWSDAQGRPIHMGGPPPAYNPGTAAGGYNAIFDPRAPSNQGGWFTMKDYLAQAPTPMEAATKPGSMQSPGGMGGGSGGNNFLSTNDWRLLPPNYRTPDHFMINGNIVSRNLAGEQLRPKTPMEQGGENPGAPGYRHKGGGWWTTPMRADSGGQYGGFIGQLGPWSITAGPTY